MLWYTVPMGFVSPAENKKWINKCIKIIIKIVSEWMSENGWERKTEIIQEKPSPVHKKLTGKINRSCFHFLLSIILRNHQHVRHGTFFSLMTLLIILDKVLSFLDKNIRYSTSVNCFLLFFCFPIVFSLFFSQLCYYSMYIFLTLKNSYLTNTMSK